MTINWKPQVTPGAGPLYLAIARALADDIATGRLAVDDKLPTQRDLADDLGVSLGTITRAYAEAEKRDLIRSEGRRGTFVGPGQTGNTGLEALIHTEQRLIDLGINFPTRKQDPDLGPVLKDLAATADLGGLLRYPDPQGLECHRRAGAEWLALLGVAAEPESVLITAGGQNALYLTLAALARPGQPVLAEEVTYPGFKTAASLLGLKTIGLKMDDQGIIPRVLEETCRALEFNGPARALYCMPDLQNPTSAVMGLERRQELVKIAARYDLIFIEDAIQRPLLEDPPPTLSQLAPERSYCLASTSKVVAAGLRVGFIKAPPGAMAELMAASRAVNLMGSPLTAEIFSHWLADGTVGQTIQNRRVEGLARQEMMTRYLGEFDLQTHPASSYAWLRLGEGSDASALTLAAHRRGVAVAPAEVFVVAGCAAHPAVRICPGTPDEPALVQTGLEVLADLLRRTGPDLSVLM